MGDVFGHVGRVIVWGMFWVMLGGHCVRHVLGHVGWRLVWLVVGLGWGLVWFCWWVGCDVWLVVVGDMWWVVVGFA